MRRFVFAVAALAATWTIAACSSDEPQPAPSTPAPAEHGSFAHCLSDHGVPAAPGPVAGPPPGVDSQAWQEAMQECSDLAPGPENAPPPHG